MANGKIAVLSAFLFNSDHREIMISKSRYTVPYLLIIAYVCLFGFSDLTAAPAAVWLKIETDSCIIYSDAPPKEVTECAVRYAAFRRAFTLLFGTPGSSLPSSTLVIFRTEKSFQTQLKVASDKVAWSAGSGRMRTETLNLSAEIDGTSLSAFAWAGDHDIALSRTFEFETIWSLQRLGYAIPLGMSQGAGEVLSTLSLAKGQCLVGHYGEHSYNDDLPWSNFFGVNDSSPAYHDLRSLDAFLGQSWGLMHWLLLTDSVNGEHFKAIAGNLNHTSALEAISAEMHLDPTRLTKTISSHLSQAPSRSIPFDEAAERARLIPNPAPEAEVCVQLANLLISRGEFAEGNAQLDRALKLAPDLPLVKEAYARRMEHEERSDDSLRLYREAIAAGSKNVVAYVLSATTRLNAVSAGRGDVAGEGGKPAELAVEELRQALKFSPGNLQAFRLLGRALFLQPNITDTDIADLSQGVVLEKNGGSIRYYRALLYSRLGQMNEFRSDLLEIIQNTQLSRGLRESAKSHYVSDVIKTDAKRIEAFLHERNYQGARDVIQHPTNRLDDDDLRNLYKKLSSLIDQQAAQDSSK